MQRNHLFRDTLSVDSSIELALRLRDPGKLYVRAEPLSRMHRERGQCGDRAPPFLGRRRGWCVPHSSPLLEDKRTKNKGQREQEADRRRFLFRNVAAVWFTAKACVRDRALARSLFCAPEWPRCHTDLLSCWPGIRDMWPTALPSLRGHRNRNSCQYLLHQAMAQLISMRYYMWLLTRSNSCESCNHTGHFGNDYLVVVAVAQKSRRISA